MFYAGPTEFVRLVGAFVTDAVTTREPVLVAVSEPKIHALQTALGTKADDVDWADMDQVGRNPGRIIPVWQDFVGPRIGRRDSVHGVGEPIDARRDADELTECHRHEALLNVAFANSVPWSLACPYDTSTLPSSVIDEARHNHPFVSIDGTAVPILPRHQSVHARPFDEHLEPAPRRTRSASTFRTPPSSTGCGSRSSRWRGKAGFQTIG